MGSDIHMLHPKGARECTTAVEALFEEWEAADHGNMALTMPERHRFA